MPKEKAELEGRLRDTLWGEESDHGVGRSEGGGMVGSWLARMQMIPCSIVGGGHLC